MTALRYVLDGNAMFYTATEVARRSHAALGTTSDAIVVGIGYPNDLYPYDKRRHYDLTPPSPEYSPSRRRDGKYYYEDHGGATLFMDFIVNTVRKFLVSNMFRDVKIGREALAGHSYGGLCTLHALFKSLTPFDTFIVLSPSIAWNKGYILEEEKRFLESTTTQGEEDDERPTLLIAYGSYEQEPRRRSIWTDEQWKLILEISREARMKDNSDELAEHMRESGRFRTVRLREYEGEDHGSLVPCGLGWGIGTFLDDERFL